MASITIGRLTFGFRDLLEEDLISYSQAKNCWGRIFVAIKLFFTGKGYFSIKKINSLLENHPYREILFQKHPHLKTLLKVIAIAANSLKKESPKAIRKDQDMENERKIENNKIENNKSNSVELTSKETDRKVNKTNKKLIQQEKIKGNQSKNKDHIEQKNKNNQANTQKIDKQEIKLIKKEKQLDSSPNLIVNKKQETKLVKIEPKLNNLNLKEGIQKTVKEKELIAEIKSSDHLGANIEEQKEEKGVTEIEEIKKEDIPDLDKLNLKEESQLTVKEDDLIEKEKPFLNDIGSSFEVQQENKNIKKENEPIENEKSNLNSELKQKDDKIVKNENQLEEKNDDKMKSAIDKKYQQEGIYDDPFKPLKIDFSKLKLNIKENAFYELTNKTYHMQQAIEDIIDVINRELEVSKILFSNQVDKASIRVRRNFLIDEPDTEDIKLGRKSLLPYNSIGTDPLSPKNHWLYQILNALKEAEYIFDFEINPEKHSLFRVQI